MLPQESRALYCLPKSINNVPSIRHQFLGHLVAAYLPSDLSHEHKAMSFLYDILGLINTDPTVDTAFDAFCVVALCRFNKDANLSKQHLHLHARALLELRKAISNHKHRDSGAVLAAISLLSLYQVGLVAASSV
jgi:hypothetical protein